MPPPIVPAPTTAGPLEVARLSRRRACRAASTPRVRRRTRSAAPAPPRNSPVRRTARPRARMPSSNGMRAGGLHRGDAVDTAPSGCGRGGRSTCGWRRRCRHRRSCTVRSRTRGSGRCVGDAAGEGDGFAAQVGALGQHLVEDAQLGGLGGGDVAAGDDHVQRRLRAGQARQALRAAAAGQDADQHLRQPDLRASARRCGSGRPCAFSSPPPRA